MKKLTTIIRSFNESKKSIRVYSNDEMSFIKQIDESLRTKPGYSAENSGKICEDLLKMYGTDFESAKKFFDQNFQ